MHRQPTCRSTVVSPSRHTHHRRPLPRVTSTTRLRSFRQPRSQQTAQPTPRSWPRSRPGSRVRSHRSARSRPLPPTSVRHGCPMSATAATRPQHARTRPSRRCRRTPGRARRRRRSVRATSSSPASTTPHSRWAGATTTSLPGSTTSPMWSPSSLVPGSWPDRASPTGAPWTPKRSMRRTHQRPTASLDEVPRSSSAAPVGSFRTMRRFR